MIQPPTAQQLWKVLSNWQPDPLSGSPSANIDHICDLMDSRRFGPILLGKLHYREGIYPCALVPMGNALNPGEDAHIPTNLRPHRHSQDLAIIYADGFPSEANSEASVKLPSEGQAKWTFSARTDKVLRRFLTLGHLTVVLKGRWVKTGHVLVLDADNGRGCHPWIVLASEWEIEDEAAAILGEETWITAPSRVGPNDETQPGILPGDHNRTTIAKLHSVDIHQDK